jgi:putative transposase
MKTAFRFRLYPNRKQEQKLLRMIEAGRQLWNEALAHRKRRWEEERLSTSYSQQCWILTAERRADPLLGELYSQAGQEILKRLDRAFKAFFEHRARYPRFKRFSESGSFTYPQAYNGSVKPDVARRRLFLSKVGNVKAVFHRELPSRREELKTCTVVREPDGEWYASLVYEDVLQMIQEPVKAFFTSPVGVDLGLKSLIATTDGVKVPHPRFLRKAERRLALLQRGLSRRQKGSQNRNRTRRLLAVRSSKVSRQRADFNHKLSAELVREHDLVAFEDLKVRNLIRNHALAKSITDAGWGQLRRFSEYKAKRAAKLVVGVPPAYSTQECCFCGTLNQIPLSVRQFECRGCGRTLDRDLNAAWIVLKRGVAQVGQDMPELKPAETGPLPVPTTGRASPVKEAGTIRGGNHATQQEARRWKPTNSFVGGCHEVLSSRPAVVVQCRRRSQPRNPRGGLLLPVPAGPA